MQTFLPWADYHQTARDLDWKRLGKQRPEVKEIFNALTKPPKPGKGAGYRNHPAVRMWKGHEHELLIYGMVICTEWFNRGYEDSLFVEFKALLESVPDTGKPVWIGKEYVHRSHRSNLLRKFPGHYRDALGWSDRDDLAYFWPV